MPDSQMDVQYLYTAGQNNGRIAQPIDNISGQTVNYTYDALNRLTAAASTGGHWENRETWGQSARFGSVVATLNCMTAAAATGGQWGQAYTYDGFGNLTSG